MYIWPPVGIWNDHDKGIPVQLIALEFGRIGPSECGFARPIWLAASTVMRISTNSGRLRTAMRSRIKRRWLVADSHRFVDRPAHSLPIHSVVGICPTVTQVRNCRDLGLSAGHNSIPDAV
jgi:hypothetical protein